MFDYLGEHPSIWPARIKEPQFFATDLDGGTYLESVTFMRDLDTYLGMFADARADQMAGEASTWYLYSQVAAAGIHSVRPDARIIAMLRDPVKMLYSLYGRRFYSGSEDLPRFEDALAAEPDRAAGRRIPPRARNVKAFQYHAVGSYSGQLQRYFDRFGRDQVHVIIFEDFVRDIPGAYRGVLEFIGVDPEFAPDFRVINAGAQRRSQRVQQLLLSDRVIRTAKTVIPKRVRPGIGRVWDRLNSRPEQREPLNPQTAAKLRSELLPDIERTSQLLGRDLTEIWR
jgi:hypothetical protein